MTTVQLEVVDNTVDTSETSFPKRWKSKLPDGWTDGADSMQNEELEQVIVDCEGYLYTIDRAKDNDTELVKAKEALKEMGASYRDAKATQTAKIKYALWLLEGRGVDLDAHSS